MEAPEIAPQKVDAWIALMRAQQAVLRDIEAALKEAGLPSLTWYDVLLELSRSEPTGLRPQELERRLLLPQYGISRLLDRLEKSNLVERLKDPEDGRGQIIRILDEGQALRARMWPVYAGALDQAFASKLSGAEAEHIRVILGRLRRPAEG